MKYLKYIKYKFLIMFKENKCKVIIRYGVYFLGYFFVLESSVYVVNLLWNFDDVL